MSITESVLVVIEGPKGPKVHKSTCKRANFSLPGHSYGAKTADADAPAASCCKPKLPALGNDVKARIEEALADKDAVAEAFNTNPDQPLLPEEQAAIRQASHEQGAKDLAERQALPHSEDPQELVRLAKAEKAELDAWKGLDPKTRPGWPPATPNLDELNRQYAAGVTAKDRKAKKSKTSGGTRTQHTDPRAIEAFARKKAGPRGKGKPITQDELEAYVAGIYPGAGRYAEQEICYWVEGYSVGKARWVAAWTKVEEARLAEAS